MTVDVEVVLGQNLGALVDSTTGTIEDTTKHVLGHTELERVAAELDLGLLGISTLLVSRFIPRLAHLLDIDTRSSLENLSSCVSLVVLCSNLIEWRSE